MIKIVNEIAVIFSFNVQRAAKCSLLRGWLISIMAQEEGALPVAPSSGVGSERRAGTRRHGKTV